MTQLYTTSKTYLLTALNISRLYKRITSYTHCSRRPDSVSIAFTQLSGGDLPQGGGDPESGHTPTVPRGKQGVQNLFVTCLPNPHNHLLNCFLTAQHLKPHNRPLQLLTHHPEHIVAFE